MNTIDSKNKILQIVNKNNNIALMITINEQGYITGGINCEIFEQPPHNIIIKQIREVY